MTGHAPQTASVSLDRTTVGRVYAELQTAAHAIKDHHRQVEESLRAGFNNALSHAIEAGRKLIYARSLIDHGGWGSWVERNVGVDGRTERLYRQLAEAANDGRLQTGNAVTTLSIRKARELLAQAAPAGSMSAEGEDNERRSRTSSACRFARQALAPLRTSLAEGSEVEYAQLVEALADELEPSAYARKWALTIAELFAEVEEVLKRRELEERDQ